MVSVLTDDHIETPILREHAPDNRCLVLGAYQGATMVYLLEHGAKHVVGYEPQKWAFDLAVHSLSVRHYGKWTMHNVALVPWEVSNDHSSVVYMREWFTDGAKLVLPGQTAEGAVYPVPVENVMEELHRYDHFDFAVINCEGAEYMLLPWLATHCDVMLVQFHGPGPMPCWPWHRSRTFVGKDWFLYTGPDKWLRG